MVIFNFFIPHGSRTIFYGALDKIIV